MFTPSARVLADSVSASGHRLTTLEATGHRFILAEFNTHRVFSRNSASSRAIPYPKMRQKVIDQLAYPVSWPAEQKGMQGGESLDEDTIRQARDIWELAAMSAINKTDLLTNLGVHKSVINRLLEPFLPHTIIVSATQWGGFWEQRCHPDAQPEIKALAEAMKAAYDESKPVEMEAGDWHLPLIQPEELEHLYDDDTALDDFKKISVARCARVSYLTHNGIRDLDADLELYNRLRTHKPAHASPFEHVATPGIGTGNFRGWNQLRHIEGLG